MTVSSSVKGEKHWLWLKGMLWWWNMIMLAKIFYKNKGMQNYKFHEQETGRCYIVIVVQLLNHVWLFMTQWTAARQASLSFTIYRVCSNSCPLSGWCHPTISSSVVPFSSCPESFPASVSFPMSQLFISGDQSIGATASVLPMNIQDWFPLGLNVSL